ncbi:MAG: GIY-YIG nuclease family protein [Microbacteriaceae bacterium]
MAYVYMLKCADGTLYVGSTRDLDARLLQHQTGQGAKYTKRRLPVELVWCSEYDSIADAFAFEKQLQGWSHAKRMLVVNGQWGNLEGWAKRHPSRANRKDLEG